MIDCPQLTVYTDGSCYWKTKEGGIGIYFIDTNKAHWNRFQSTPCNTLYICILQRFYQLFLSIIPFFFCSKKIIFLARSHLINVKVLDFNIIQVLKCVTIWISSVKQTMHEELPKKCGALRLRWSIGNVPSDF